jgi:hypothetical protein
MRAINVRRQPPAGQPYNGRQPALNGSHFPALHKGATAALAKCDGLTRPSRSWKTTNACLQGHHLAEALRTKLTDAQEAAMQGDPTAVQVALTALLTPAAAKLVSMIHAQGKQKLAISITGALLQELCGPHSYMYVTRHTAAYLAARYQPHTQVNRSLFSAHVGVDGSLRPPERARQGWRAVAFLTAETSPHTAAVLTAHIATCTYCGEQTVANSEYAGYTLALQTPLSPGGLGPP